MRGNRLYATLYDIETRQEIPSGDRFVMLDFSRLANWAVIRVGGFTFKVNLDALERATI